MHPRKPELPPQSELHRLIVDRISFSLFERLASTARFIATLKLKRALSRLQRDMLRRLSPPPPRPERPQAR